MENAKFFSRTNEEGEKKYLFCIVNDFLEGYRKTEADEKKRKKHELTEFFELYDDDDEKYYSGYMNSEILEEFDEDEFEVLNWGTYYAGCTYMKTRSKNGKMEIL